MTEVRPPSGLFGVDRCTSLQPIAPSRRTVADVELPFVNDDTCEDVHDDELQELCEELAATRVCLVSEDVRVLEELHPLELHPRHPEVRSCHPPHDMDCGIRKLVALCMERDGTNADIPQRRDADIDVIDTVRPQRVPRTRLDRRYIFSVDACNRISVCDEPVEYSLP